MIPTTRKRSLTAVAFLLLLMLGAMLLPTPACAQEKGRVVRVGWYESPFNVTDEHGRRSGYAYDYQQRIAAYTGWSFEYVEGSWSELLQMLTDGKIDLMSDVSYTDERAKRMLFSALPMGEEQYYLYASPSNTAINPEDYSTFNGKRVGVNKGSIQIGQFNDWAQVNGVSAELVELTGTEEANLEQLSAGKIDLYLSPDGFFDKESATPICKVGTSDYYFAVSKSQPGLLAELNGAMGRIKDENQYFDQQLYAKYLQTSNASSALSTGEREWLEGHGAIRVGYQDNYLAFCAKDPESGELTGALKDYLEAASNSLENAELSFEPVCFPTSEDAMEALQRGEVDCVFPTNLTAYDGEMRGVYITQALMRTDMSAVIREAEKRSFAKKDRIAVAVNAGNPNYDMFLQDHFPDWQAIYFNTTQDCLKAVADGQADCLLISNYRYNNIAKLCDQYRLTTWSTGIEMDYCLAVSRQNTVLYSILSKAIASMSSSTINAALTTYYAEDARTSVVDSLNQNLLKVAVGVLIVVVLLLLAFLLRGIRASRRNGRSGRLDPGKEHFSLFDDLPLSYSVYRVTHVEHSEQYDAKVIYVNHKFEQFGGLPQEAVVGRYVRELFPYVGEEWFASARRAALEGELVEYDYVDPLTKRSYSVTMRQVAGPGYCAVTYLEA